MGGELVVASRYFRRFIKYLLYCWPNPLAGGVALTFLALSQTKRDPVIPTIISVTWAKGHKLGYGRYQLIHEYVQGLDNHHSTQGPEKMVMTKNQGKSITGVATFQKRLRE